MQEILRTMFLVNKDNIKISFKVLSYALWIRLLTTGKKLKRLKK